MEELEQVCADVKAASRVLAGLPGRHRDAALAEMAEALERRSAEILRENQKDVEAAKRLHAAPALICARECRSGWSRSCTRVVPT